MQKLPDFLNRRLNPVIVEKASSKPRRVKTAKPPKAKKWKDAIRVRLVLADQAPSIGCGHRTVWAKVGRTWAHLADNYGGRAKISISNFNKFKMV
jgi:hypothetical protein